MDAADQAQQVSDQVAERVLAEARARSRAMRADAAADGEPAEICEDCPDPIDAARRAAQPGARRCTPCQAEAEAAKRGAAA